MQIQSVLVDVQLATDANYMQVGCSQRGTGVMMSRHFLTYGIL